MKALAFAGLIISLAMSASAAVIISDSFDTSGGLGLNDDLGTRQAGTAVPPTRNWVQTGGGTVGIGSAGVMRLETAVDTDKNAYLDYDVTTAPGLLADGAFTISFDMASAQNYGGFFIGNNDLTGRPATGSGANDFKMLIRNENESGGNSVVGGNGVGGVYIQTAVVGVDWESWVFTFETENFNAGTSYTASLTIDGNVYDLNGNGRDDPSLSGTNKSGEGVSLVGTWDGGAQYIGFSSRNGLTRVDNFALTAIPEPGTASILLAGGIVLLLRRVRRLG